MVREGIVLGHLLSERGIEVDKAKIEVIEQLQPPKTRKTKRSPTLEDYAIFKEDEELRAPEDPTIAGLKRTIKNLRADLWEHKNLVNDNQVRMASLEH
jgi:hypothetical protein